MKKVGRIIIVLSILTNILNCYSQYQFGSSLPFLLKNPSPMGSAMGNIGAAYNPDDAFNIALNPAHLGNIGKEHNFLVSTNTSNYSPSNYYNFGLQFGLDLKKLTGIPLNAGIAYLRQSTDLGEFTRTTENGTDLGKFHADENVNSISLGVSLDYWAELSIGLTYKILNSNLTPSDYLRSRSNASALDAGFLLSMPVLDNLKLTGDLKTDLKANIGYSIFNMGNEIEYGREKEPLPLNDRFGYSIIADFKLPIYKIDFSILKIVWSSEIMEYLVKNDSISYWNENTLSQLNITENFLKLNNNNKNIQIGYGMRFTLFDSFSYMFGNIKGNYNYTTNGFEISSKGIVNYLCHDSQSAFMNYIKKHIELSLTNAKITGDIYPNEIEFNSICLKLNNMIF